MERIAEEIYSAIAEDVDPDIPQEIIHSMNRLSSLVGSAAAVAAEGKFLYDSARRAALEDGTVKKSDSTGHVDSQIHDARKIKEFTELLQQNLRIRINTLQSILSYKKSERDATPR